MRRSVVYDGSLHESLSARASLEPRIWTSPNFICRFYFRDDGCDGKTTLGVTAELHYEQLVDVYVGMPCSAGSQSHIEDLHSFHFNQYKVNSRCILLLRTQLRRKRRPWSEAYDFTGIVLYNLSSGLILVAITVMLLFSCHLHVLLCAWCPF